MPDSEGRQPLWNAVNEGRTAVVELLLNTNKVDTNAGDIFIGTTPLHRAAFSGHLAIVKLLLKQADVEIEPHKLRKTPIELAAANGHYAVVKELLEAGAHGRKALTVAKKAGHEDIV
jgi:hypothetical protein